MILPDDVQPERTLYFLGGVVLGHLPPQGAISPLRLLEQVQSRCDIGVSLFALTLDWLYLIDAIDLDSSGDVFLCF